MKIFLPLCTLLFLLGCGNAEKAAPAKDSIVPVAPASSPAFDATQMRLTFTALEKLHSDLVVRMSLDSLMELYDESARVCPENGSFITGKAAIRNYWSEQDCTTMMERNMLSLDGKDGLAYEIGIETGQMCGTKIHNHRMWNYKYVTVWKMQDGKWKIVLESWNKMEE